MHNFIKARLNKDNFWNLMFFQLFFIALSLGNIIPQPLGIIIFFVIFIGTIILIKYNCPLTFDKDKLKFTTNLGITIQKSGIGLIFLVFTSAFVAALISTPISKKLSIENSILEQLLIIFFTTLLTSMYCILQNFPIAVYFKKEAWSTDKNNSSYPSRNRNNSEPLLSGKRMLTDPRNQWYSGNIYHRK